jgi:hypothetical protein
MVAWLDRYEKVSVFQLYLDSLDPRPVLPIGPQPPISLPKHPSRVGQSLQNIVGAHHCPGLTSDLKSFLNQRWREGVGQALNRNRLEMTQLPFDKLDVYHGFKFAPEELAEEEGETEAGRDWMRARPKQKGGGQERFDTVVVMRSEECEATRVQGKRHNIIQPRLLFHLATLHRHHYLSTVVGWWWHLPYWHHETLVLKPQSPQVQG